MADAVDGPFGRAEMCPDMVVGLVVPVVDLVVLLVHAASSGAITAAERSAEPRRGGRTTAVCHRLSHDEIGAQMPRPFGRRPQKAPGQGLPTS